MNDIERRVSDLERRVERIEKYIIMAPDDVCTVAQDCVRVEMEKEHAAREGREEAPEVCHLSLSPFTALCGADKPNQKTAYLMPEVVTCDDCSTLFRAELLRLRAIEAAALAAQSATVQTPAPELPEVPSVERLAAELLVAKNGGENIEERVKEVESWIKDGDPAERAGPIRMARCALAILRPAPAPPTAGGPADV